MTTEKIRTAAIETVKGAFDTALAEMMAADAAEIVRIADYHFWVWIDNTTPDFDRPEPADRDEFLAAFQAECAYQRTWRGE